MNDTEIFCEICGENKFTVKDGFYYCDECGTQTQNIRDVVFENDEDQCMNTTLKSRIKVKTAKTEKQELTSWECFNYLLRGLVEELIGLGAKDELRLVTLQLWTHYLRVTEVAFFNKKHPELPKLNPRYSQKDAKILYNHSITRKKIKKKKEVSGELGRKELQKQKTKFMQSEYEKFSLSQSKTKSESSYRTSLTNCSSSIMGDATSTRAIRLSFTTLARKHYKKRMNLSHLRKHEMDSTNELNCHLLHISPKLNLKLANTRLSRKTIYTILYIALNLIEDDIQLSDMLRFMNEGHLSSTNIMHFFPDDIAINCKEIIKLKIFYSKCDIFSDLLLRTHTSFLCRLMNINELKVPNLYKLIDRYVNELNLPEYIKKCVHRLMNLCPKQNIPFKLQHYISPFYEGRAMALIIFVMKLLFGLDDNKEILISESAKNINNELENIRNSKNRKLFVFTDWIKFIEMRNIIISQCHLPTAIQSKQLIRQDQYIEQYKIDENLEDQINKISSERNTRLHNLQNIFESFQVKHEKYCDNSNINDGGNSSSSSSSLKFPPSLTPNRLYLSEIIKTNKNNIYIPNFMYEDISQHDIKTFVNAKNLKNFLLKNYIKLNINQIECKKEHNYIGVFRLRDLFEDEKYRNVVARKIKYNINENVWIKDIQKNDKKSNIIQIASKKINSKPAKIIEKKSKNLNFNNDHNEEIQIKLSNHIFNENNMEPYDENYFRVPRRDLDFESLFDELSDDDDDNDDDDDDVDNKFKKILNLNISNFDYWLIFGRHKELSNDHMQIIKNQFSNNFMWLINTCSNLLGIDWHYLFKEILIVENYFSNVLEPFDNLTNIIKFQTEYKSIDMEPIVNHYKNLW